jgi:Dolichyl-phosphate-mannose-protein mannosyltransferase
MAPKPPMEGPTRVRFLLGDRRLPWIALAVITSLGAALRVYHLGFRPLWFDEAVIFWIGRGSFSQLLSNNATQNSGPPLFPALVSLVSSASITEVSLRSVSWLAGTLAIPAMFFLARRFMSTGAALAAAFLMAIAPSQIHYSQQLREYSLSVLVAILILLATSIFLEFPTARHATVLAALMVLGVFTQYGLALLILATNLALAGYLLLTRKGLNRNLALKWAVVQTTVLVASLVVYVLALRQQFQPGGFASEGHLGGAYWTGTSATQAIQFAYAGARDLIAFTFPGYVFTLTLYAAALVLMANHRRSLLPLLIALPIATVVAAAFLRAYPWNGGRQDIFLTPLVILAAGTTIDYLLRIERTPILVCLLTALMAWRAIPALRDYYPVDGEGAIGKLVARVAMLASPGEVVYTCLPLDPVLRYYLEVRYPMPANPLIEGIRGPGPRDYLDQVDSMLATYRKAWLLTYRACGDVAPLIDHIARTWDVRMVEERYPDARLFLVEE